MVKRISSGDFEEEDTSLTSRAFKYAPIVLFFLGLFLVSVGAGLLYLRTKSDSSDIQILSASQDELASQGEALRGKDVIVHVDGAVKAPGVYKLASDARVGDVVEVAGGLTDSADSSKINLAAKVSDGQKIHVVSINDTGSSGSSSNDTVSLGLININTAAEAELDKLPGVGPATAKKIIASRPYSSLEDLTVKKAVTSSTFGKIKDLITVY